MIWFWLLDDEQAIVDMSKRILEHAGHEVYAFTSSLKALETCRSHPDRFDLIITDMTMPGMTGADLSVELLKTRPDIPIVICTGFSESSTPERTRAIGMREVLMKPVPADQMKGAIQRIVARQG